MTLFAKASNTSAFLKMGLMGFAGSGKTFTSSSTSIGLITHMREREMPLAEKPMFFLDTEKGSDWVKKRIEGAGIELHTAKTRAFVDLLAAVKEAQANSSILLIDSITHFWVELCDSYAKKQKRNRLFFEDWAYLKSEWRKFTDGFVNSPLHIILCGRAGFEYDYFENEAGKKELEKTDIKMKAEGEMGYEPDLLVLMERDTDMATKKVDHVATVMKDRSDTLDGKRFVDPTFESFLPHIQLLNLGGPQLGIDTSRTSEHFVQTDKKDWQPVQRRIAVDETQTLLVLHVPGQAAADKKRKAELIRKHFNASWTEIEEVMPLIDLRIGYDSLHRELEGKPSRYSVAVAPAQTKTEINDEIPDFLDRNKTDAAQPAVTDDASNVRSAIVTPKEPTLKERLLSDIPNLKSFQDCTMWGFEMGHIMSDQLAKGDQDEIALALIARQKILMNGHGEPVTLGM